MTEPIMNRLVPNIDWTELKRIYHKQSLVEDRNNYYKVIADSHNQGTVNLIEEASSLSINDDTILFIQCEVYAHTLPYLNITVEEALLCCVNLQSQLVNYYDARKVQKGFENFITAHKIHPQDFISLPSLYKEEGIDFLEGGLIAGSYIDFISCFNKCKELLESSNDKKIKIKTIYSLGYLNFNNQFQAIDEAIAIIEKKSNIFDEEISPQLLKTVFRLAALKKWECKKSLAMVQKLLSQKNDKMQLASAEVLELATEENNPFISESMNYLKGFNIENQQVVANINLYFWGQEQIENYQNIISYFEILFDGNDKISVKTFSSISDIFYKNSDFRNLLATKWLKAKKITLANQLTYLVQNSAKENKSLQLHACTSLINKNSDEAIFLTKKAIGYLYFYPIQAMSFILSLIPYASDDEAQQMIEIVFDPLIISYPKSLLEHMQKVKNPKKTKLFAQQLIDKLDNLTKNFPTQPILELSPPEENLEAWQRNLSKIINKKYSETMKNSFTSLFYQPITTLFGNSFIHSKALETGNYSQTPLQHQETYAEVPLLAKISPHTLEMTLFQFKSEEQK